MPIVQEFKDFISKGSVIDMAVGVVIGVAFNSVISALVADLVTPLIGIPKAAKRCAFCTSKLKS